MSKEKKKKKSHDLDSIPQPPVFKSDALPTELNLQMEIKVKYFHHIPVLPSEVFQCVRMMQFIIISLLK